MVLPAGLVLLRAAVVVHGEDGAAELERGRAEVDRRLAAVRADLEHRAVRQPLPREPVQGETLVVGHEALGRACVGQELAIRLGGHGAFHQPDRRRIEEGVLANLESSGILSTMESGSDAEALRDAERARDEWAEAVVLPPGHDLAIGAAVAVQIATTAIGLYVDASWARWMLAGGVLLFGVVAAVQLWRFTRLNGVRVARIRRQGRLRVGRHGVVRLRRRGGRGLRRGRSRPLVAHRCRRGVPEGSSTSSAAVAGCAPTARSRPASVRGSRPSGSPWPPCLAVAGLVLLVLER